MSILRIYKRVEMTVSKTVKPRDNIFIYAHVIDNLLMSAEIKFSPCMSYSIPFFNAIH